MVYLEQFKHFLRGLLNELDEGTGTKPPPVDLPPPQPLITRVRLRILRAQYNRKLFPEKYTPENQDGLYSGKELEKIRRGESKFNRESNVWYDLTAFDRQNLELQREQLKRLKLGYETIFRIGDGFIAGGGQEDDGRPKEWEKQNPSGCNISEEAWRTSLGFTVRVHHSDEGTFDIAGAVAGVEGEPFTVSVS
jgi:hypothetical protein